MTMIQQIVWQIFFILTVLSPLNTSALSRYVVPAGTTVTINEFAECVDVTNNSPLNKDLMVPTNTSTEWTVFKANPPTGVTVVTPPYSPHCEGVVRLWLDASDSATVFQDTACSTPATTNGTAIGCWKDKSGVGNNQLQATAIERPTLNTAQMNGRNVLLFAGTNKPLQGNFTATASGLVIFVVLNYNNASGNDRAYFEIHTAGGNRHFLIHQRYSSNNNAVATSAVDSIIVVHHPAGTATTRYQDSTLLLSDTSAFGAANGTYGTITLGDDSSGGNQLRAKVAEVLIFQGTLTLAQRQKVEGYLACRWGTQGRLPGAHPYKVACP